MLINKAVLPIAGLGTRFLPVTKVIPKEMLPLNGKPILQILIEEAYNAGITDIILVINKEKEPIIRSYLSPDTVASLKIAEKGKDGALSELKTLLSNIKFHYVFQEEQLGDGHAILQAEPLANDEPFVVLFGDDIIVTEPGTKSAVKQLIEAFEEKSAPIIALEEVPKEKIQNYGVLKPAATDSNPPLYKVEDLVEKPEPDKAPSNLGIIGKYIVTPEIFPALKASTSSHGGEIRLIDGFKELMKTQPIYGLKTEGKRYDTGTLNGYRKAILELESI